MDMTEMFSYLHPDEKLTAGYPFLIMVGVDFVVLFLAWYIDTVFPTDGVGLSLWFMFTVSVSHLSEEE